MELRFPYYYKYFKCIADKCSDSCCMHWEIDIDESTLNKYKSWPGEFGFRLKDSIYENEEGGHFKMDPQERCVFLNSKGLCDLILNIGEENLCDICREHPRYYDSFSFGDEAGIGLCCEAAAELILDSSISDEIVSLEQEDICKPTESTTSMKYADDPVEAALMQEREFLLGDPDFFSYLWKTEKGGDFASRWADSFFRPDTIRDLSELLLSLEISSPEWSRRIEKLKLSSDSILYERERFLNEHPSAAKDYQRLIHYFIYRYYMKARFEEDIEFEAEVKLQFAMLSVGIILLLDLVEWLESGRFSLKQQIDVCKLYSQEIEYDTDNIFALEEFCISSL